MTPLLSVEHLHIAFADAVAVHDLSFRIAPGERLALLGESGSGKSVSARCIAGLVPDGATISGRIAWPDLGHAPVLGRDVGFVFQDPLSSLNPVLRVGEQVAEVLITHRGLDHDAAWSKAAEALTEVGIADAVRRVHDYPHQFSGGQRQRIAIAMAIVAGPRLLIADEPTTALDTVVQAEVMALLDRLVSERGMALLLITHDLALAAGRTDRVAILRLGRLEETGPTAATLDAPQSDYGRTLRAASLDVDAPVAARAVEGAPILALRGITRRYGRAVALAGVDLDVRAGETLALVGGSGAGKTTLARIVARLLAPDGGTMRFMEADLLAQGGAALRRTRRNLQMVFQDPLAALNPRATIGRLLADPLRVHGIGTARDRRDRCAALLDRVGLPTAFLDRHPHEISGGQRQRVNIARAVATEPKLIVLDEPVSSLDVSIRAQVLDLLRRLQADTGMAYLFVTHDLGVVRAVAHRVAVMAQGRIVEQGPVESVYAAPQSDVTRALLAAAPRFGREG